jgi:hypothetical protein
MSFQPMSDYLKAALYFDECAEQELRPTERARLLRAARQFRWLAIAEARRAETRRSAERLAAPLMRGSAAQGRDR